MHELNVTNLTKHYMKKIINIILIVLVSCFMWGCQSLKDFLFRSTIDSLDSLGHYESQEGKYRTGNIDFPDMSEASEVITSHISNDPSTY